ncbi:subtilase family protein [Algoriphagus ratkowskyi]|uniref:S8 family serine peptidase n=1 Tax=Algoriphagus ratkowskyi TaxID=57028 RepID=A0A2W7RDX6_9BACT|nr:S8 family serine peptidase [Algoriphagus ratkowskyi]PZX53817.1 subtilase family protein [Algoriphagus ratkowskyi]TXD76778.1 S8 family serine peptidase [Algoriphagus ratkowskyi]
MKKIFFPLLLCLILISCKRNQISKNTNYQNSQIEDPLNPMGINSADLIPGSYLFFLDEEQFQPIIGENFDFVKQDFNKEQIKKKKQDILNAVQDYFPFKVTEDNVFVISFSAISIENITTHQALEFLNNPIVVSAQKNFTFQNIRATMQGNPVDQNIRAKMQEWQYDSTTHLSTNVKYVNPNGEVGNLNSKIWIVDSGIDGGHQDLKNQINKSLSVSFVPGESNALEDEIGHGTHCAGIAAGLAHNNSDANMLGMNGVSPGAPLVSIKVINKLGFGNWQKVMKAMEYIVEYAQPFDIINLSIGAFFTNTSNPGNDCKIAGNNSPRNKLLISIYNLAQAEKYVVMAAGNEAKNSNNFYPGCFDLISNPYLITVGSIKTTFDFTTSTYSMPVYSDFSTYIKPSIDFVAPGEIVFSTYKGNLYAVLSGTSMSAAMVSGIIHASGGAPTTTNAQIVYGLTANNDFSSKYPIAKVQ